MPATLAELTREFLTAILPANADGYLCIAVARDPFISDKGKYSHRERDERAFRWPAQADQAIEAITFYGPGSDVYFCPYLMKTPDRHLGNAMRRELVHSDLDGLADPVTIKALGGLVVWSGTTGHGHVYIRLSHTVTADQHKLLCEGLRARLGGDAKIRENDLLRPAYTYNQKATISGGPATLVYPDGDWPDPVDPLELGQALGVNLTHHGSNGQAPSNGQVPADAYQREPVDLSAYPGIAEALRRDTGDRSHDTWYAASICAEAGLTLPQTRWVIDQQPDWAARVAEMLARSTPKDDVADAWAAARARHAWAMPAPGSGPLPPPPPAAAPALSFFGKHGLRPLDVALAVAAILTLGYGQRDHRFYVYAEGVWMPEDGQIQAEITRLLGNRYRMTQTKTITDVLRHLPTTERITDEPLAEYVNVPNGMLNWATGDLAPHSPNFGSTVQLPVEYVPGSTCPQFEVFLAEVLPPDLFLPAAGGPGFIWELIGYTMFSGNPLHVAILLHGKGRNGKGTLIRVLEALLGQRNISTVGLHELVENRFRVASLFGKLANLAGDLDSKWLDNTALFKKITGGDPLQGEHKYGAVFDFTPWALPFYSINKPFGSADSSEGWVARWIVVPFPNSFLGREDRGLTARLTGEAELRGILRRGVEALPALMARGRFAEPQSLIDAKAAFVVASDAVRAWVDECCDMDPTLWTPRQDLYRAYQRHVIADGTKQLSAREFYNRIEQINGVRMAIRQGIRGFSGVQHRVQVAPIWT